MYTFCLTSINTMRRFYSVIIKNLFRSTYMIPLMRFFAGHPDRFSEEQRYGLARHAIHLVEHSGHIRPRIIGLENLPASGGYIMYPNHQGKYDALGIMTELPDPCSFVIADENSHRLFVREFTDLLQGKRLRRNDLAQAASLFSEITADLEQGKRYILFPEGGYENNKHNAVGRFRAGSFKPAKNARVPIVPVALINTYKVFNGHGLENLGRVRPVVEYLEPIPYEEYRDLRTSQIAALVQERIEDAISSYCA